VLSVNRVRKPKAPPKRSNKLRWEETLGQDAREAFDAHFRYDLRVCVSVCVCVCSCA
jgi:hypothetical protein